MTPDRSRFEKGWFAAARFPISATHVQEPGRTRLFVWGGVVGVMLSLGALAATFLGAPAVASSGPLSSSHSLLGGDCASCHTPVEGVTDAKCLTCHQEAGATPAAYTFESHYIYRSGDVDRSAPAAHELPCAGCHVEHEGRQGMLRDVADRKCASCHETTSFARHPEFGFAAKSSPDPANLRFPHTLHVREVMEDNDLIEVESACAQCHVPRADRRGFEPTSFARDCDDCHLSPSTSTPPLPVRGADMPGVLGLAEIRRIGGPSAAWADNWNPNEIRDLGGEIEKRPVYHADPWVLYNLERLRAQMYPGSELADLLRTSPEVPVGRVPELYEEAVATLRDQIEALRGEPSSDVQRELTRLNDLLAEVERRSVRRFEPLDETRFDVAVQESGARTLAYRAVVDSLTSECRVCHVVERATIRRVQTDQHSLIRAEFDHRAHVSTPCLDCHADIPVRDALLSEDDPPAALDNATIQNLPRVETCQSCHTPRKASSDCTTCHVFHPGAPGEARR